MTINTKTSTPMSASPKGRFGRKILVAAAGSVVLASAVAGSFMARGNSNESAAPAVHAAVQQSTQPVSFSHTAGYTPHTVYIVGSQEQAAQITAAFNDANLIRSNINESPLMDEVFVAESDGSAASVVLAESDANRIRFDMYGVENRSVDLRG